MAKVFITASNRWSALYFAQLLNAHKHEITSDWHNQPMTRTRDLPSETKTLIADDSAAQIQASDALLIISDFDNVPGGKHVDTGIAIGNGIKVILVGQYENLKQWNSRVIRVDDQKGVLKELG